MAQSHAVGPTDIPLLEETIGACLERTVARFPDAEALVSRHQGRRYTYRELDAEVDRLARGMLAHGLDVGDRVGIWSPNYAEWMLVQFATAKIGAILVNINPAYRTNELAYALNQSGCRWLIAAPTFKTSDYVAMVDEVRGEVPALERTIFFWSPEWEALWAAAEEVPRRRAGRASAAAPARGPDQHPVHVRHDGLPQGRHADAPEHPQQRLLRRGSARASAPLTGSASRCPSTTASAWSWATSAASPTAPRWSSPTTASTR